MLENTEMIYTAIYQSGQGRLTRMRYLGEVNKQESWLRAARDGAKNNLCLVALVPGDHPVYFYENFVSDEISPRSNIQDHDVFEMT